MSRALAVSAAALVLAGCGSSGKAHVSPVPKKHYSVADVQAAFASQGIELSTEIRTGPVRGVSLGDRQHTVAVVVLREKVKHPVVRMPSKGNVEVVQSPPSLLLRIIRALQQLH